MSTWERPLVPREAELEQTPAGSRPAGDGWFVLNATEAVWKRSPGWGRYVKFERDRDRSGFRDLGLRLHRIDPGERSTMYHSEEVQEDFLVVSGACLAIVEGREARLRTWDLLHCPPWTRHTFVNDGDAPCVLFTVGARRDDRVEYAPDPLARAHGAAVEAWTDAPAEAYAGRAPIVDVPYEPGTLPGA